VSIVCAWVGCNAGDDERMVILKNARVILAPCNLKDQVGKTATELKELCDLMGWSIKRFTAEEMEDFTSVLRDMCRNRVPL
jgi:hypothetical protein